MIMTVLDEEEGGTRRMEGRKGRREEEEGGTGRKEGRVGRRDWEEGGTRRVKNENVVNLLMMVIW